MIKEVTYYDIICDCCGKSLTKESGMCFPDTESAEMVSEQSEWKKIGGKHYCADCYKLDEDTDKYVPKKGGEKISKILYCGECEKFAYEDANGYGVCIKNNDECRCSDKCHITFGKP